MAKEIEINVSQLSQKITEQMDFVLPAAREGLKKIIKKAAAQGVKELKETSPVRTGQYASGWTSKMEEGEDGTASVIVYNSKKPWLTHLLENGHLIKKTGGRTKAFPHIYPAQENMQTLIESELNRLNEGWGG